MRGSLARNMTLILGVLFSCLVNATGQISVITSSIVRIGDTIQLVASVTGTTSKGVTWEVNGIVGGNTTVGIVSPTGLYVAPSTVPNPATVRVTAISKANPADSSTTLVTVASCSAVPSGMVSWWPGEKTGQDVYGNNRGTVTGGVTFTPAEVALGFNLDGSTGYINVPNSSSLSGIQRTVSVEMWASPRSLPAGSSGYLFSRRNPLLSESFSIYIRDDGTLGVLLRTTSSPTETGSKFESAPGAVTFGKVQHIAATADTNTSTVAAYINGVVVPLFVVYGPSDFSGTFAAVPYLYLGRRQAASVEGQSGAAYFPGTLDEVSLYSSVLSQSQIASIVAHGLNGKCR